MRRKDEKEAVGVADAAAGWRAGGGDGDGGGGGWRRVAVVVERARWTRERGEWGLEQRSTPIPEVDPT